MIACGVYFGWLSNAVEHRVHREFFGQWRSTRTLTIACHTMMPCATNCLTSTFTGTPPQSGRCACIACASTLELLCKVSFGIEVRCTWTARALSLSAVKCGTPPARFVVASIIGASKTRASTSIATPPSSHTARRRLRGLLLFLAVRRGSSASGSRALDAGARARGGQCEKRAV